MGELKVQMLGGFALRMDGRELLDTDTRSKKAWILLAYLICQRENTVPQKKLIDLLWGEEPNSVNPENALRITMHRTRALLGWLPVGYARGRGGRGALRVAVQSEDGEFSAAAGQSAGRPGYL